LYEEEEEEEEEEDTHTEPEACGYLGSLMGILLVEPPQEVAVRRGCKLLMEASDKKLVMGPMGQMVVVRVAEVVLLIHLVALEVFEAVILGVEAEEGLPC
jgi:hypothetical protein